jgi:prephenate dehydratase
MTKYNVLIIAEIYLKINFHLISFEGNTLENIKQVYSHPVALGQIRQFLHEHKHIQALEFSDTAGAVNMIKQKYKDSNNKYNYGAVASAFAAHTYGMTIIKEDILENQNNYTRFFLLKKVDDPKTYEIKNNIKNSAKVSLEFQLGEEAGTLYKCLEPFAKRDIAIVKIESRPIINTHWQFTFYMDIKADYSDNNFKAALSELINNTAKLRVIGYYHKGDYIPT